ncbi:hypothetical protein [Streptomyces prasinopilosus]|uniref:hypothetical protein n=1 Tax=Streptomyces prasinopilosus TaxID=67344 RepID=UPI0006EB4E75|nr:hypothetical protein [Streptomyces prasinopilosus]
MLALRLTRGAPPAVQLRRLLVVAASAGTGFLLLCALGHAIGHPDAPSGSLLRLAWCAAPLAATVYFAVAVARTDPGAGPRPGLSALGLGPVRMMAVSATATALTCALGSVAALLVFLHLRGDLTGTPFGGSGTDFLATGRPLPLPATLTLLTLVPGSASVAVAVALRPRERAGSRPPRSGRTAYGRFGAYRATAVRETFGAYGRFGRHLEPAAHGRPSAARRRTPEEAAAPVRTRQDGLPADPSGQAPERTYGPGGTAGGPEPAAAVPGSGTGTGTGVGAGVDRAPSGLPWGVAVLAVGLAVGAYASRAGVGAVPGERPGALAGPVLACVGLVLAGPGLTHLCGRLLQSVRPGALRLLAGRLLMAEAARIGRPLGVVCAVLSGAYALDSLYYTDGRPAGPLALLGVFLVAGCTVATLLTAAAGARQAHAGTRAALRRLGAPSSTPRRAAALRAGALLALFGPLTVVVAHLSGLSPAP